MQTGSIRIPQRSQRVATPPCLSRSFERELTKPVLRASTLVWFPTRVPKTLPNQTELIRVLGESGKNLALKANEEIAREVYAHVAGRGFDLSHTPHSIQQDMVHGLRDWFEFREEEHGLDPLQGYETRMNDRIVWQPGKPVSRQALLFHLCTSLLRGKKTKDRDIVRLLNLLPKKLAVETSEYLVELLRKKRGGVRLTGAPGRLALYPIFSPKWNDLPKPDQPQESFVVLYLPFDPKLAERFRDLEQPRSEEARETDPLDQPRIGPQFFDPNATFPGAFAYAKISVYQEGNEHAGVIHLMQSEVAPHHTKFTPKQICSDLMPLLVGLLEMLDCKQFYVPTYQTLLTHADQTKATPAWFENMQTIFGNAPRGFNQDSIEYRGQPYYMKTGLRS